jgi:hypothetical protein
MIYFLLTIVTSMDFGIDCNQSDDWRLEDMLLPGLKTSWEARNETAWRRTLVRRGNNTALPGLRFGLLLSEGTNSDLQASIDTWLEGVDELGLVVSMASRIALP